MDVEKHCSEKEGEEKTKRGNPFWRAGSTATLSISGGFSSIESTKREKVL